MRIRRQRAPLEPQPSATSDRTRGYEPESGDRRISEESTGTGSLGRARGVGRYPPRGFAPAGPPPARADGPGEGEQSDLGAAVRSGKRTRILVPTFRWLEGQQPDLTRLLILRGLEVQAAAVSFPSILKVPTFKTKRARKLGIFVSFLKPENRNTGPRPKL